MNKYLKYIYFAIVSAFTLFIFFEIRYGDAPANQGVQNESEEFKTLAEKRKILEGEIRKAELRMAGMRVDPEFESMIEVSEGTFTMGNEDGHWTEQPERQIRLSRYFIDKYEVTFAQYYAFVNATEHRRPRLAGYLGVDSKDLPRLMNFFSPVVGVSWEDAAAYCRWKGKRLPTEAEWERAAKGTGRQKWPWGDEARAEYANLKGEVDGAQYTSPVGAFPKDRSPEGLHDLAGNVMEWIADWYQEGYYRVMPALDPIGPKRGEQTAHFGEQRVIRGGSWNDSLTRAQTSVRFKMDPFYRDVTIGFRCARSG